MGPLLTSHKRGYAGLKLSEPKCVFWYRFANYLAENFATLVGISRLPIPKIRFSDQEFSIACAACSGDLGVNHHTLHRWLTERQSPKKGNLALTAGFLSRVGYL